MTDLTPQVMQKIKSLERQRLIWWLTSTSIVLGGLLVGLVVVFLAVQAQIAAFGSWELLEVFKQDWVTMRQYAGEALTALWGELPQDKLLLEIFFLVGLIWTVMAVKAVLPQQRKKLTYLKEHD